MFVNQLCLALERWHHLGYMCPGVNKPVSLATSSYVTEDRTERWWQCCFMAPSNHTCQGNWPIKTAQMGTTNRLCLCSLQLPNKETDYTAFSVFKPTQKNISRHRLAVDFACAKGNIAAIKTDFHNKSLKSKKVYCCERCESHNMMSLNNLQMKHRIIHFFLNTEKEMFFHEDAKIKSVIPVL